MTMSVTFVVASSDVVASLFFGNALLSGVTSTGLVCFIVVCEDLALLVTLGTSSATRCAVIRTITAVANVSIVTFTPLLALATLIPAC